MKLTEKQKRFCGKYEKEIKGKSSIADMEEVVKTLIYFYIMAEKESVKEQAAWLLAKLKPNIKLIGIEKVIDIKELNYYIRKRNKKRMKVSRLSQKRRHERRNDFALNEEEWIYAIEYFDFKCAYCGRETKLTYDHFIPFSKGGSFTRDNIIPCCKSCNSSKNNKEFKEWYKNQPYYNEEREIKVLNYIEENKEVVSAYG